MSFMRYFFVSPFQWLKKVSVIVFAVILSACSTTPTMQGTGAGSDGIDFFRNGRFAVSVQYPYGQRDAVQGGFSWAEHDNQLRLDLRNPMGSVLARVEVNQSGASLYRTDGSAEHAPGPDALVEQVLGTPIPVSKLRHWLRGASASTALDVELETSRPVSFSEDGWRVRLQRYDEHGPRLLQMNRNDADGDISVRLVIDN
ncbi:lipoprotein insertase outer membrane protein LolB [Paenalcaligenes niemegkensis]|uniref:lipoprotein insertase outer membrane protein LolB n=1 Tax=Paenalcaligenes niemegkensis TaxID=2895469 RepID=UPI001EE92BC9|nr:lipoprotein insertase outer membrane protein LolB [Paenalcaligenes niemegkensis]MCQ9617234.1 lipoprotein insertase outer membrane protein LolB [Paenalcaligenes niemegkensis]